MFSRTRIVFLSAALLLIVGGWLSVDAAGSQYTVVAWNDLGMHCVDGNDYSVFSILPPYNNLHAQIIDSNGKLIKISTGYTITYQAAADPTGSIDRTSASKTNFWTYVLPLFGVSLAPDIGLAGYGMPGGKNTPQAMGFDPKKHFFYGQGIPILPYDDKNVKNYYPLMRIVAKSGTTILASTKAVLPVSDEIDCSACHASGSVSTAEPAAGWVYDPNKTKDFKRNILRIHDERKPASAAMLKWAKYNTGGLEATYNAGTPILCARCHSSNALGTTGYAGVPALTTSVHSAHVHAVDPTTGLTLGSDANREACYRCHPGSTTKCLRGIMGSALNPDGTNMMQCQSCHGLLAAVGSSTRHGWLDEPNCQACHTGTAVRNSGRIRYTSALDAAGNLRIPADTTFATTPNTPSAPYSLYKLSSGHGGLQCEACHGSTHAEFPSTDRNDNLQSIALQGYAGPLTECKTCHGGASLAFNGGPHGLHPVGQTWVEAHHDIVESQGSASCQNCHGMDYKGTVLSAAKTNRTFNAGDYGTVKFPAGTKVSCYTCHNGPNGGDRARMAGTGAGESDH
jgi:hypothetical protein